MLSDALAGPGGPLSSGPMRSELEKGQFGRRVRLEGKESEVLDPQYGDWDLVSELTTPECPHLYVLVHPSTQLIGRGDLLHSSSAGRHSGICKIAQRNGCLQVYILTDKEHQVMQAIGRERL